MSRPTGPQVSPVTAREAGDLLRQLAQLRADLVRELSSRSFYYGLGMSTSASAVPTLGQYLVQVDINGRLGFWSPATFSNNARKWRKIADLDASGNLRVRGAVTAAVVFPANEDL